MKLHLLTKCWQETKGGMGQWGMFVFRPLQWQILNNYCYLEGASTLTWGKGKAYIGPGHPLSNSSKHPWLGCNPGWGCWRRDEIPNRNFSILAQVTYQQKKQWNCKMGNAHREDTSPSHCALFLSLIEITDWDHRYNIHIPLVYLRRWFVWNPV